MIPPRLRDNFEGYVIASLSGVPLVVKAIRLYGESNPTIPGRDVVYATLFSVEGRDFGEARSRAIERMFSYARMSPEWAEILQIFEKSGY